MQKYRGNKLSVEHCWLQTILSRSVFFQQQCLQLYSHSVNSPLLVSRCAIMLQGSLEKKSYGRQKKNGKLPTFPTKGEKKNDDAIAATRSHVLKHCTHNGRPKFPLMVSSYITCKPRSGKQLLKTHPSAMRTATPALQPPPWKNFPQGL